MTFKLKQLFFDVPNENNDYVSYQNKLKPRCIFSNEELKNLFYEHYKLIMKIVENEITTYINNENLCNDDEDMFPRKNFLTGEWYISEIDFDDTDYLSINTAFIGTDLGYKDDYLGLEVHLYYDEETAEFIFDGIDSSAL
ncbi:MAG: hypothetical protein K2K16_01455 [Ruminococcus sp.]|nr:hypothetical protein [Ruminococcus sp.]MDE6670842.1 hypothetical protein [Ruminococcus sp.]